jgi:hypothetical protein
MSRAQPQRLNTSILAPADTLRRVQTGERYRYDLTWARAGLAHHMQRLDAEPRADDTGMPLG